MRKSGYYWIKTKSAADDNLDIHDGWEVAFYDKNEGWYSIWDGGTYSDDEMLLDINETPLSPMNLCRCENFNGMHVESVTKCNKCNNEIKSLKL